MADENNDFAQDADGQQSSQAPNINLECDFLSLNLAQLQAEKEKIELKSQRLQNELSDLAFHNYRTYVDVGRTAEYCKDMFSGMGNCMQQLRADFPSLAQNCGEFRQSAQQIQEEFRVLDRVQSTNSLVWEFFKLPKMMEKCIRTGRYEQAYAMTNFALNMKQTKLAQNPLFKNVVDYLLEARHNLLDELFNKFAGPLDLARSIQIVNNIRKIPYISNIQLRISILQYRDIYLEKKVHSIMSEPDFLLRVIEVYRECMYDTIVLYLAVFPDADVQRKFVSMNDDPRWERWTSSSQNYLLHSWAQRNIERLLTTIRGAEHKTLMDMEAMIFKLMSFAYSFGRMGLDFRLLVSHEFSQMIVGIFKRKVEAATKSFIAIGKLDLIDGDIFENTRRELQDDVEHLDLALLSAPLELCIWDDLCVFGNQVVEALNEMRHSIAANFIRPMFDTMLGSLQSIFAWLDSFLIQPAAAAAEQQQKVRKAAHLLLRHFAPFLNRSLFHCFPYEQLARQHFRAEFCTGEEYRKVFTLSNHKLFSLCRQEPFFADIARQVEREMMLVEQQQPMPMPTLTSPTSTAAKEEEATTEEADDGIGTPQGQRQKAAEATEEAEKLDDHKDQMPMVEESGDANIDEKEGNGTALPSAMAFFSAADTAADSAEVPEPEVQEPEVPEEKTSITTAVKEEE